MIDVIAKVKELKAGKIKQYPCKTNRASECGHPCLRYLVYCQKNWQDRVPPTVELQYIFDQGNDIHDRAVKDLQEAGLKVLERERPFEWRQYNITGKIDCMLSEDGHKLYPCEIKSMSEWDWQKIESAEDMILSPKGWIRKYPAQLILYLLMSNSPEGLFYIVNKKNGQPKQIWMALQDATDYDYAEKIIKNIEQVNKHLKEGTLPDRIDYDDSLCSRCSFSLICLPDIKNQAGLQIIDNVEVEELLKRRDEIISAGKEYKKLDDKLKEYFKDKMKKDDKYLLGDFMISIKEIPKHFEAKEVKDTVEKHVKIINLNQEKLKQNAQNAE